MSATKPAPLGPQIALARPLLALLTGLSDGPVTLTQAEHGEAVAALVASYTRFAEGYERQTARLIPGQGHGGRKVGSKDKVKRKGSGKKKEID